VEVGALIDATSISDEVQDLPAVSERYRRAITAVVAEYRRRPEVMAIILAGSVVRGEGGLTSDLDFWLPVDADYRRRKSFLVGDVPVEVFTNPPEQIMRCISSGDYHAMHMMGFGTLLWLREDAKAHTLVPRLRQWCRAGYALGPPPLGEEARKMRRYAIIDRLQDAYDILRSDPPMANLLMSQVVDQALDLYYAERRVWQPKGKRLLLDLRARDADLARLIERFAAASDAEVRHQVLLVILDHIMGKARYGWDDWSWESALERVR
jgi:predicted nucleotidyltransferase